MDKIMKDHILAIAEAALYKHIKARNNSCNGSFITGQLEFTNEISARLDKLITEILPKTNG